MAKDTIATVGQALEKAGDALEVARKTSGKTWQTPQVIVGMLEDTQNGYALGSDAAPFSNGPTSGS